jgi:hypothetical protein
MKNLPLLALAGLAISFAAPAFAQQQDTVDPKIAELIVAHQKIYDEAMNNNDAVTLASKMFTDDAVLVTDTGPIYGRAAIEKYFTDLFQKVHFSNCSGDVGTKNAARLIATTTGGTELWRLGHWINTVQGEGWGPIVATGYWSAIEVLEDGILKDKLLTWNVTPTPPATAAATPSPTITPSSK